MNNKKILHANDDNHNLGGAFIITYRVERYLRKYGYSYDYLSMDKYELEDTDFPMPEDDKTYSARFRENRLIGHILLPFYVNKILKKSQYEIIHIDSDAEWKVLLYAIPAKKNGVKVLVHSHSTGIDGEVKFLKKVLEKIAKMLLPKFSDRYIACSNDAARWMAPYGDISKVKVIFNGIDFDRFYYDDIERKDYRRNYHIQKDTLVLGNVAALSDRKNQKFILDILKNICARGKDVKLILIGDDNNSYGDYLKVYAEELQIRDRVIFAGLNANVRQHLNMMDVFVFPSIFEGAPLSLYEAEATGLDCVASDTISKDVVISDWCVQLSLRDGVNLWANEILKISNEEKDRKSRVLDSKYGLDNMARQIASVYREIEGVR